MEANEASLGSGDATTRAQELRANLGARQVAETLLAEAGRVRQDAALAADAMVEEAQELSSQLLAESRRAAEQINAEARGRADDFLTRARVEAQEVAERARIESEEVAERARIESEEVAERARASADATRAAAEADIEEHRRRVRAEVTAQLTRDLTEQHRLAEARAREQSEALISDLEASVRILGVSLQSAVANVSELLGSIEGLRSTADPEVPHIEEERPEPEAWDREEVSLAPGAGSNHLGETSYDGHQTPAPVAAVPSATSQFGTEPDEPEMPEDRPRTATEAFLTSSSLEIEQASRELRDLQHPEEARRRRGEESRLAAQRRELEDGPPNDDPDPDPTDGTRPLGWLFRTTQ